MGLPTSPRLVAGVVDWANHPERIWVKQCPREGLPAPKVGWEGSDTYDPHSRKWLHLRGHHAISQRRRLSTWHLATDAWEQEFPNASPPGVCCVDGSNVFDVASRVYTSGKSHWEIVRLTEDPVAATTFTHAGGRGRMRYWVVAADALGQEGQPSSPVWREHSYTGCYDDEWHP